MFYAVIDADAPDGAGEQVVPVDHFEVVGDSQQDRQIVLVGGGTGDFDKSDFEEASPKDQAEG